MINQICTSHEELKRTTDGGACAHTREWDKNLCHKEGPVHEPVTYHNESPSITFSSSILIYTHCKGSAPTSTSAILHAKLPFWWYLGHHGTVVESFSIKSAITWEPYIKIPLEELTDSKITMIATAKILNVNAYRCNCWIFLKRPVMAKTMGFGTWRNSKMAVFRFLVRSYFSGQNSTVWVWVGPRASPAIPIRLRQHQES